MDNKDFRKDGAIIIVVGDDDEKTASLRRRLRELVFRDGDAQVFEVSPSPVSGRRTELNRIVAELVESPTMLAVPKRRRKSKWKKASERGRP